MSDVPSDVQATADRCILCLQEFGSKDKARMLQCSFNFKECSGFRCLFMVAPYYQQGSKPDFYKGLESLSLLFLLMVF